MTLMGGRADPSLENRFQREFWLTGMLRSFLLHPSLRPAQTPAPQRLPPLPVPSVPAARRRNHRPEPGGEGFAG